MAVAEIDRPSPTSRSRRSARSRSPTWSASTPWPVADHLHQSYGERFYVHQRDARAGRSGELGVKSGRGLYERGAYPVIERLQRPHERRA